MLCSHGGLVSVDDVMKLKYTNVFLDKMCVGDVSTISVYTRVQRTCQYSIIQNIEF